MRRFHFASLGLAACLAACSSGNLQKVSSEKGPAAPFVRNPRYNPYAGYGTANATWVPPVFNRDGTITKPADPTTQGDRGDYENAEWAAGSGGGGKYAPAGTY